MLRPVVILPATMLGISLAGCDAVQDILPTSHSDRQAELKRKDESRHLEDQCESLKASLKNALGEKSRFLTVRIGKLDSEINGLRADIQQLTKTVAKILNASAADGQEPKYEIKILNVMKDAEVNALAVKYVGSDFSSIREEYIERVRAACAADERYRKALDSADDNFTRSLDETRQWSDKTRKQRDQEVTRLRKEISGLNTSWEDARKELKNLTRGSLQGNRRQDRERYEKLAVIEDRVRDIQDEIQKKRRQLDALIHPDGAAATENAALRMSQVRQREAQNAHSIRLRDIDREMKPKRSVADVVAEFEGKTIGAVRVCLQRRLEEREKDRTLLEKDLGVIRNMESSLNIATFQELQKIREDLVNFRR